MTLLRVLVADSHPLFRAAAARLLSSDPHIQVVGCAESFPETLEQAAELQPDIVVMEVLLPGDTARSVVPRLKALPKAPQVVVLSFHDQPPYREFARTAGADAFLSKAEAGVHLLPLLHNL